MRSTQLLFVFLSFGLLSDPVWVTGQITTTTENDGLSILDAGVINRAADFKIGGALIQNGFSYSQITDQMVSAGSDLVRSNLSGSGFGMRQFAVSPYKTTNLDLNHLQFIGTDPSVFPANDEVTWEMGVTEFGDLQNIDFLDRAFYLDYKRLQSDLFFWKRLFLVNPDEISMAINPGLTTEFFSANFRVYGSQDVALWVTQEGTGTDTKWGLFSKSDGSGSGVRYGVSGFAEESTGAKYGVYGSSSGSGTGYAVFASGILAFTGGLVDTSDRKLKKQIEDFDGLETILALRPKTYEFRNDEYPHMNLKRGKQYGFIAQELQEVIPEMVSDNVHPHVVETDSGLVTELTPYLGIQPLLLLPILTRALQEEHEIVEDQGIRLRHLEQENQALRNRLADLESQVAQILDQNQGDNGNTVVLTGARLDQNFPNPYDQETAIGLYIPPSVQRAELHIINPEGKRVQTLVINGRGETRQVLEARALAAGTYFYSLVLDGKPFETKQMLMLK